MAELLRLDDNMPVIKALIFLHVAAHPGVSGLEVSEQLRLDPSRVSRNLQGLEEAKLIKREKDEFGSVRNRVSPAGGRFLSSLTRLVDT